MSDPPSVSVIIPALNEELSLPHVLDKVPGDLVQEIVVVDNGSTDRTAEVARRHGAAVIYQPRRGYGAACMAGIAYLKQRDPDVVVFMDADFADNPSEAYVLVETLRKGGYDLIVGSRVLGDREPGALPGHARLGNALAVHLIHLLWGYRYTDLGPFRSMRFRSLLALGMQDPDYGWTVEMQIRALKKGMRVTEVPVSYRRRIGRSKVSGSIKGSVRAGHKIIATIIKLAVPPS